jgi:hypothetical protein
MKWLVGIVLAVLFAVVVAARWPAGWALQRLPAPLNCLSGAGTLWDGACDELRIGGQAVGQLSWQLKFLPLLTGRVNAQVSLRSATSDLSGQIERRTDGKMQLSDVNGSLSLPGPLAALGIDGPQLPAGLSGRLTARQLNARLSAAGRIEFLRGELLADQLRQSAEPRDLGSWTVSFDGELNADGEPVGQLQDRGGPFNMRATLRLTAAPGFVLQGALALRGDVSPQVLDSLRFLGRPDAAGRRPITIEGSF